MRARVIGIESGKDYTDQQRRIKIRIEDAETWQRDITMREDALGVFAVAIDDQLEVEFHPMTVHARREQERERAPGSTYRQIIEEAGAPCVCGHLQIIHGGSGACGQCFCEVYRAQAAAGPKVAR